MKQNLVHYAVIFAAAFGITALANVDHILDARGLDALKSAAVALLIAAAKAGFDAVRAQVPAKAPTK